MSCDIDLEVDNVPWTALQPAQYQLNADLPAKQVEEAKTMEPTFDSGISSMVSTSITDTRSDSLDICDKSVNDTSVSKLSTALCQISLTDSDLGDSLKEKVDSLEPENKSAGEKIIPEKAKNLSVQESIKDDGGYCSFKSQSTDFNINAIEVELDLEEILAETDEDGDTLIHTAVVSRDERIAVTMIDLVKSHSKCLDVANKLFQTVLHLAVLTDQRKIVQKLVAKGCDLTVRDQQGNTALHIACRKGSEKLVKDMVGSLADNATKRKELLSIRNCEGLTCLHLAAQGKHYEIMGYLFARGADVNIGDTKSGRTILHYAVEKKDVETVVVLLTHPSIDIDCETYKGETPLLLAYWRNYQDIVKRLKANGAFFSYDLVENDDEGDDS